MNSSSFRYGIVNEDDLAAASIVGCGKEHTLGVDVADAVGLEVSKDDDLATDKHFGGIVLFNGRHDHALANAVEKGELEARVGLANGFSLQNFANT